MNSRLSENLTSDMYERHADPLKTNYGGNSCFTIVTAEVFNHTSKHLTISNENIAILSCSPGSIDLKEMTDIFVMLFQVH